MAGENFGMATRHMVRFQSFLQPGEILQNAGEGIQVETSERLGRGRGDGLLGVSDQRLLFVFHDDRLPSPYSIPRPAITSVERGWIIIPGSSSVKVTARTTTSAATVTFYVGNAFSRDIVALLS